MKKITPYFSNNRLSENSKRSFSKSNKLSESMTIDDMKEIFTDRDIAKAISKAVNNGSVILIGQERGNQLVPTIEDVCDNTLELDSVEVSCRELRENRNIIDELYNETAELVVITDLEIADPRMLSLIASYIDGREGNAVVCTTTNPEALLNSPIISFDEALFYVPQYDKMSYYNDELDESVSQRFAKYRKLYEEESMNEDDDKSSDDNSNSDDNSSDDNSSDDNSNSDDDSNDDNADDNKDSEDDTVDVPMTAVVLTVKKEDADKCKDELIEAGISEDNIEIIEGEEDDEDSQIKVDADSVKELKDYLAGKGIDLEEKIGGEIIDDEEDSSDEDNKSEDDNASDEDNKSEEDQDFDDLFGDDFFSDDEESSDEK